MLGEFYFSKHSSGFFTVFGTNFSKISWNIYYPFILSIIMLSATVGPDAVRPCGCTISYLHSPALPRPSSLNTSSHIEARDAVNPVLASCNMTLPYHDCQRQLDQSQLRTKSAGAAIVLLTGFM